MDFFFFQKYEKTLIELGWVRYDLLGADLKYNRSQKSLNITMERYIAKMAKRFRPLRKRPAKAMR